MRDVIASHQVMQYAMQLTADVAKRETDPPASAKRYAARTLASAKCDPLYKPFAHRLKRRAAEGTKWQDRITAALGDLSTRWSCPGRHGHGEHQCSVRIRWGFVARLGELALAR